MYLGIAANAFQLDDGEVEGCEIWKYDGSTWTPVMGDDVPGAEPDDPTYDGFGNHYNKYAWSMEVCNGKLWVGTANTQIIDEYTISDHNGCEVWSFDGSTWTAYIKDTVGDFPNGFGKTYNIGARSMIEFPQGSNKLFIGTFKLKDFNPFVPEEGCEVWKYYQQ